jgi:hypothetical protein
VAVLAVAHDLAGYGQLATPWPAQLADDPVPAPVIEVYLLSGERRAAAVDAAATVRLQGAHAAAQQKALELIDVGDP